MTTFGMARESRLHGHHWLALIILWFGLAVVAWAQQGAGETAAGQNVLEDVQMTAQNGGPVLKVRFAKPLAEAPGVFTIAQPARIAFDFANMGYGAKPGSKMFNDGDIVSANIVQAGERTRLVLNLRRMVTYSTRIQDRFLLVSFGTPPSVENAKAPPTASHFAEPRLGDVTHAVRSIDFRRGKDGDGRIVVSLGDPGTAVDVRQQGSGLVVDLLQTSAPEHLLRRMDVTDFGTPVTTFQTARSGNNVRITLTPKGLWEHNAYQSDNQFVLEVKPVQENPNKLVQGSRGGYSGEKLSLNFQNVDVRAVLQVIADFTNFNIITSDTVQGNVTLRLKDVPWDQALDIILQAKGLDMRKNGNVIWIAPREELAVKEKADLESRQQISDLEPTKTEAFQLNYQRADAVQKLLTDGQQSVLSKRGSVVVDQRTNKIFVRDIGLRLDDVRRLIAEIDVPVRQVLIEARIVEAEDTFAKSLGVRLGLGSIFSGQTVDGSTVPRRVLGGGLGSTSYQAGQVETKPDLYKDGMNANLPASSLSGKQAGAMSFILYNAKGTRFLDLELSALEADGRGKIVSSPRVVTADGVEALIEQGVEIPYQQATSSGATAVSFRKANLSLKVKPNITPDGRILMALDVSKDSPNTTISTGSGVAIDTKHIKTEVLIENGGTVVIGGIYTQDERSVTTKIPFFGDLPYVGFLFKTTERKNNKGELLVFVTPKIVTEALNLR